MFGLLYKRMFKLKKGTRTYSNRPRTAYQWGCGSISKKYHLPMRKL